MVEVDLMNPREVAEAIQTIGWLASVSSSKPNYESIGLTCLEAGHLAATRAFFFKFEIRGISRACSHQLVRHSIGFNPIQRSQRVCSEANFRYITPETLREQEVFVNILQRKISYDTLQVICKQFYNECINRGVPKEDARYCLTEATETAINLAVSYEAMVHLAKGRLCERAQWEIRNLVQKMVRQIWLVDNRLTEDMWVDCDKCREVKKCHL